MSWHRALAVIAAMLIPFTSPARGELPVHRVGVLSSSQSPENIRVWEASTVIGVEADVRWAVRGARGGGYW